MSDTSVLKRDKSSDDEIHPTEIGRSRSLPSLPKADPITLYTSPPDGVPSILFLLLLLTRDILTFFIRGGLSTLMLSMDIVLRLFTFVFDSWLHVPGAFLISYTARFTMRCYQIFMWLAYSAVELLFYLPAPMLALYLIALIVVYYRMPDELESVLRSMLWVGQHFLRITKRLVLFGFH